MEGNKEKRCFTVFITRSPDPPRPLPPEITVRTPSPDLHSSNSTPAPMLPTTSLSTLHFDPTIALELPLSTTTHRSLQMAVKDDPSVYGKALSIYKGCATTLPWAFFGQTVENLLRDGLPTLLYDTWSSLDWRDIVPSAHRSGQSLDHHNGTDLQYRLALFPTRRQMLPRPSHDLGYRLVTTMGSLSPIEFVSTCLYLLSNKLHDDKDEDKGIELLCSIFEYHEQRLATLLQRQLRSAWAAWDPLLRYAMRRRKRRIFRLLVRLGIQNEWLHRFHGDPFHGDLLSSAIYMDCFDMVKDILNTDVAEPGFSHACGWRVILGAIVAACEKGLENIARLIMRRFGINNADYVECCQCQNQSRLWIFLCFVLTTRFNIKQDGQKAALHLFLSEGAEVNKTLPSAFFHTQLRNGWYDENEVNLALRPTILDLAFRINRPLYEMLTPHSKVPISAQPSKIGLLLALEDGSHSLQNYIAGSWPLAQSSLELLWIEEMNPSLYLHSRVSLSLCSSPRLKLENLYTLLLVESSSFDSYWIPPVDMRRLLDVVLSAMGDCFALDGLRLLELLIQKGVTIGEIDLAKAVQRRGCEVLLFLESRVANFSAKASRALAAAASLNNFEAVRLLLRNGANPRAFLNGRSSLYGFPEEDYDGCFSLLAAAAGLCNYGPLPSGEINLEMCKFWAKEGAQLVVSRQDTTPFAFAMGLLSSRRHSPVTFSLLEYIFDELTQRNAWANPPALLLELSINEERPSTNSPHYDRSLEMFKYLLDRGAEVSPGSPLPVLSRYADHVSKDLIRRVLSMGAKLDDYCTVEPVETPLQAAAARGHEDLVNLFLQSGAEVNSPAGEDGYTALQGICSWDPATEEEHGRKMRIYHLLVSKGADVNSPTATYSFTPLQAAASGGDLELAVDLLSRGDDDMEHITDDPGDADIERITEDFGDADIR